MLKKELKTSLTIEVESELLDRVKLEAKRHGFTLRQLVEYGLKEALKELEMHVNNTKKK